MNINKYKDLSNPLVYIFITFILSSISYEAYSKNKLMGVFYVCSFFAFILYFKGIKITILIFLFFVVALNNNIWFYSYIPKDIEAIRITNISNYYYAKGEINGRIVNLYNINQEINVGDKLIARGEFSKDINIVKGIVGDYKIEEYYIEKDDIISKFYKRREELFNKISEKLGRRKAALITSVSFGYKSELDEDHKSLMKNLGISHAISISGLHLALVYSILKRIFGVKLSLVIAFAYVLFTGAPASAVRAYIMILILNLGMVVKRNYSPLAALSLAGIIIILIKPYDIYNLGFILSFLATLGIILFSKKLNKKLYRLPNLFRSTIAISISAQILTFPIILLYFNEISLNFIIGNIIVVPFINILVVFENCLVFFEYIPILFNFSLYICHYIIKYIDVIMYKLDSFSFGLVYLHYTIAYFYVGILVTYYFYRKGFKVFLYYPLIIGIYTFLLIYSPFLKIKYYNDGALLISYRGERVLIQTKEKVDEEKLKAVCLTNSILNDLNKIKIDNKITLTKKGENYILTTDKNEYLLFVNYEKNNNDYDIIDFRKGDINEITLFNDEVINN